MTIDTRTEETCPQCQGTGRDYYEYHSERCSLCQGDKKVPLPPEGEERCSECHQVQPQREMETGAYGDAYCPGCWKKVTLP